MKYNLNKPWETLDPWQKKVLECKGNLVLRSGRQVGKSTIISIKVGEHALNKENQHIMVIAKTERQAHLIFSKILNYIMFKDKNSIKKGKDRPTKSRLMLKNKTIIHCLPAGDTGYGIMGYTIDLLVADEAAFIPEEVWNSIIPTLTITRGKIILLSTPFIKEGYYYNCFNDPSFTSFHMSAEDCPRKDQEFLDYQKSWMTKSQYAQMYLGQFIDELRQLYNEELILQTCKAKRPELKLQRKYFLGVDIARMGKDASVFSTFIGDNNKNIIQVENIITRKTRLTMTEDKIIDLDRYYNYGRNSIGIDDGGLGAGVFDTLLRNNQVKRKIVGLNNARREIDKDGRKKKLMKEVMYIELLRLMERKEIKLLDDDEIKAALRSIQYEYDKDGKGDMKIWGEDDHIVEAIIRAVWLIKNKSLNIYFYT